MVAQACAVLKHSHNCGAAGRTEQRCAHKANARSANAHATLLMQSIRHGATHALHEAAPPLLLSSSSAAAEQHLQHDNSNHTAPQAGRVRQQGRTWYSTKARLVSCVRPDRGLTPAAWWLLSSASSSMPKLMWARLGRRSAASASAWHTTVSCLTEKPAAT